MTLDGKTLDGEALDGKTLDGETLDGETLDGETLDCQNQMCPLIPMGNCACLTCPMCLMRPSCAACSGVVALRLYNVTPRFYGAVNI